MPGQPAGRPVDPDSTGGYYQPIRYIAPGQTGVFVGIAEARLTCSLAGAFGNVVVDFAQRYHGNTNPGVDKLLLSMTDDPAAGSPVTSDGGGDAGAGTTVPAGRRTSLRASWVACPQTDVCGDHVCGPDETLKTCPADCTKAATAGCTGAERFAAFDLGSQSIVDQRESMAVAWFATGGSFDDDRTGRASSDDTNSSDNAWTAPGQAGPVHIWIILRDDRGGVGWADYTIEVQ
jgi:hypothetical protein